MWSKSSRSNLILLEDPATFTLCLEIDMNSLAALMLQADYATRNVDPINWELRLKIALGVARGLSYLHFDCIPHIIHRDIKCSNILLDENMEAHVADFGLAKLISPQATHVTTIAAGTLGYLPPGKISQNT